MKKQKPKLLMNQNCTFVPHFLLMIDDSGAEAHAD